MTQAFSAETFSSTEDTLPKNTNAWVDGADPLTTSDIIILSEDAVHTIEAEPPIEESHLYSPSESEEYAILLGRQASNLALAIGVSNDPDVKIREAERFIRAGGYDELDQPEIALSKQAFIMSLVDELEMKTKTETAAALKAQNEALRQQIEAIKEALKTQPKDVLLAMAPFLKLPKGVDIDVEEFASEVQDGLVSTQDIEVPSTAELEAQLALESTGTNSPARGITIAKIGHWTVDVLKKSRDYILPPLDEKEEDIQHKAELTR